ncbi:response regulator transcription factor [Sphaerisporangium sp. NPDC004334]
MRVLLIEDDERMAKALGSLLRNHSHEVVHAASGAAARQAFGYDLMLLDLGLPDEDGLEVCRSIREFSDVPIIMLSARGTEHDRILGLRTGADDYLVKPFSMAELEARMQAVMRRPRTGMVGAVTVGDVAVDHVAHAVHRAGHPVALTRKEFAVLSRLIASPGEIVSRDHLLREIWNDTGQAARRTLDVHITNLRAKLGAPNVIQTVRGVGYRVIVPSVPEPTRAAKDSRSGEPCENAWW